MIPVEKIAGGTIGNLVYYVAIIGVLILVATFLRLKVPFLRKAFIPASLLAGLIGLIPNCGASVLLTQMYLHGVLPASHLIAGLLDGAGVGLLILFRVNPDQKENLRITLLLYLLAVVFGMLIHLLGISF